DAAMAIPATAGGAAKISSDGYLEGAPEFVAEVAYSSVSIDLHRKKDAYRRNGVREYVVWRVNDGAVDWFMLRGGDYVAQGANAAGLLKSEVFPGLWLDPVALMAGNLRGVMEVVQRGAAGDDHAAFAARVRPPTI